MQNLANDKASAPLSPAAQLARSALPDMTEQERLQLATQIAILAHEVGSVAGLKRLAVAASEGVQRVEAERLAGLVPETSRVDPEFMAIFMQFYGMRSQPSVQEAYRLACLQVTQNLLPCTVSSIEAVRWTLGEIRHPSMTQNANGRVQ